jgi:hypothetical protein
MDIVAKNEITANIAVVLRPHITDKAFANLLFDLGIKEKDIEEQPIQDMFGGGDEGDTGEGGSPFKEGMNPIKEKSGRDAGEKKNLIVRQET